MILNKLSTKFKDPGGFSIPCLIGNASVDRALYDLGSSVNLMPQYYIFKRLDLGQLRPTNISLQ